MKRMKMTTLALLLTLGCYAVPKPEPRPIPEATATASWEEYRLRIGDQLSIKFFYDSKLDEDVVIRPDGRISLPLVGEVAAAGRTPAELRQTLVEAYTGTLRQPEPTIIVRGFGSHAVYVGGEVQKPGAIELTGSMTALQAIFAAGGHKRTAELETVVVLRFNGTTQPEFFTINLIDQLEGRARTDALLRPQDMVFVPKTWIGHVNDFVDLYFDDLFPASRHIGLGFSYDLKDRNGGDTTFITNNP